jgi:hypothetical protein
MTRLTAAKPDGYNSDDYNQTSNKLGFGNFGHKLNFFAAIRDLVNVVLPWFVTTFETLADGAQTAISDAVAAAETVISGSVTAADESATAAEDAANSALQSKLGIGYYGPVAASDETTPIIVGNGKVTFRMPYAYQLSEIRAALNVPQTSGAVFTVDVKRWNGATWVSIFSTPLTFDNGERTTASAAVPAVLGTTTLADDDELRIDVTQVGDGTAKGLKVLLKGAVPA